MSDDTSGQLTDIRLTLGDVATTLSSATDSLVAALGGASVDDQRDQLRQVSVDVAEAWRHAVRAHSAIRVLITRADLELESWAADERAAQDEPPAAF